jgi:hypothetical protein
MQKQQTGERYPPSNRRHTSEEVCSGYWKTRQREMKGVIPTQERGITCTQEARQKQGKCKGVVARSADVNDVFGS